MEVSKYIVLLLLTIVLYSLSPAILLLIILPNQLFRCLIRILKKLTRKKLNNLVSPLSNIFGVDNLYDAPTATLVLGSVYEGILSKPFVCQIISQKWLDKRWANGSLTYPELRQGLNNWFGLTFWDDEPNFDVRKHVNYLNTNIDNFTKNNLSNVFVNLVNQPFKQNQSPWEIIIVQNYMDDKLDANQQYTLILFKVHHSLIDGVSMLKLGARDLADFPIKMNFVNCRGLSLFLKTIAVIRIPYFLVKSALLAGVFGRTTRNQMTAKGKKVDFFAHRKIDVLKLKELKSKYKVSLTSLLLAGLTATVRFMMMQNGIVVSENSKFPCVIPVPIPDHPEKLRNHMSFVCVNLPVHETCPRKRLLIINEILDRASESTDTISLYYLLCCIGSLPRWAVNFFMRKSPPILLLSNFPGLSLPLFINGHRCVDLFFNGGLLQGNIHMICSCVGYCGTIGITLSCDEYLGNSEATLEEAMQLMTAEFNELEDQMKKDT